MTSRGLPLLRKAILYRACVRNAIIYGRDAWPVKKYHLIRLKKNDGKWLEKCAMLYKIKDHRKCLQNKRLRWSSHLQGMEGSSWPSKCLRLVVV